VTAITVTYPGPEVLVDLVHSGQGLLIFILPILALALALALLLLRLLIGLGFRGRRVDVRMIVLALAGA
jgi:hypothetical protein